VKTLFFVCVTLLCLMGTGQASEPLETETANTLRAGTLQLEGIVEYQTSVDGREFATPMAIEYGITNDLEFLIEPVFYTVIAPSGGTRHTGLGDAEATATFRFLHEGTILPNTAIAAELKIPTANDKQIGTGKFDYTGYLILSKHFGPLDLHANYGYTFMGAPAGTHLKNVHNFAAAAVVHLSDKFDLLSEFLAATSPVPVGMEGPEGSSNPEISGGEVVGMLGGRFYLKPKMMWISLAGTYDNQGAFLFRTAFSYRLPTY
jgi:hypothetical protein